MKKYIYPLFAIFLLLGGASCSDFLDEKSRDKITAGDPIFQAKEYVTGTYGMFLDYAYAFSYLGITEIISDNADKGSTDTDEGGDKAALDLLTFTTSAGSFHEMWTHWYKSIGRATEAINFTQNANISDQNMKNRLIGEAKFLRALNYFFLVRGWGAVPIQEKNMVERAPVEDVYAYIEQDLTDAIAALPAKSQYSSDDLGRATKEAAQGLLSKVYLYQKKWQQAYDYANLVLNTPGYSLEPNYEMIWRVETENGRESLFEFQGRAETEFAIRQYSATQGPRGGSNSWGWGFNTPTDDLVKAFDAEGDQIRKDATIIFRGETMWDGNTFAGTENPMYNQKAYSSIKGDWSDKNIRYLRLGEIYLIKAEAANELGNTSEALSALNTIRARVKLANVTTTNKDDLRKAIWKERRLELAFEHDRWFDLVRTGQASSVMKAVGKPFKDNKHELFPITSNQLNYTPNMPQNPGW